MADRRRKFYAEYTLMTSKQQAELFEIFCTSKSKHKRDEARNKLVNSVMPWIILLAKKQIKRSAAETVMDYHDLAQYAAMWLVENIFRWNPKIAKLTTWVSMCSWRHMHRAALNERRRGLATAQGGLTKIARLLRKEDANKASIFPRGVEFIGDRSCTLSKDGSSRVCPKFRYMGPVYYDERLDEEEEPLPSRNDLDLAISMLPDLRHRKLLHMIMDGHTCKEIAKELDKFAVGGTRKERTGEKGISRERVRQMREEAIDQLSKIFGVEPKSRKKFYWR